MPVKERKSNEIEEIRVPEEEKAKDSKDEEEAGVQEGVAMCATDGGEAGVQEAVAKSGSAKTYTERQVSDKDTARSCSNVK